MKIIKGEQIESSEFNLMFSSIETPGWGYSFPCDESGKLLPLNPTAAENYAYALSHPDLFVAEGVVKRTHTYWQPAVLECSCGQEVELSHFTNTCSCGLDYNMSGQVLAPRQFWGEETGESLSECI